MNGKEAMENNNKRSPVLCSDRSSCCGCSACFSVCPAGAIRMEADEEGFAYPRIDGDKCVHCLLCEQVCAFKEDQEEKTYLPEGSAGAAAQKAGFPAVYAAKYNSDEERLRSQSGGMFAALSDHMLKIGGTVYGCAFDEAFKAVHVRADDAEGRDRMRYSKYVQSDMGGIFSDVEKDLMSGRSVLFSGTSCQVAGLRSYLQRRGCKNTENLCCTDIVCHGVPSPLVWADYLAWESRKAGSAPAEVLCRDKRRYGWRSHVVSIRFQNGKEAHRKVFPRLFYSHRILRPACYQCPYKSTHHPGDITIADFWADAQALPGFRDDKGVSLVLINSERGARYFDACADHLDVRKADLKDCMQKPLQGSYDAPGDRALFWEQYRARDFEWIAAKYSDYSVSKRLKWGVKELMREAKKRRNKG